MEIRRKPKVGKWTQGKKTQGEYVIRAKRPVTMKKTFYHLGLYFWISKFIDLSSDNNFIWTKL